MNLRNAFHAELVEEIHAAASNVGYEVVLAAVTRTRGERVAIETLLDSRCEAVLLLGPELPAEELVDLDRRTPVIVLGRRTGRSDLDVVRVADDAGVALVVDHLVRLGHRNLLHVSGGAGDIARDRRDGFLRAVARHELTSWARVIEGDFSEEAGQAAAATLLSERWPTTGIVAANDRVALGLLDSLARADKTVPQQISVVGYDDSPLAKLAHVQLTSISQEPFEQARRAVQAALERLDGGRSEHHEVVLDPQLIVRGTTGHVLADAAQPYARSDYGGCGHRGGSLVASD